jgi:hypothetical protein
MLLARKFCPSTPIMGDDARYMSGCVEFKSRLLVTWAKQGVNSDPPWRVVTSIPRREGPVQFGTNDLKTTTNTGP